MPIPNSSAVKLPLRMRILVENSPQFHREGRVAGKRQFARSNGIVTVIWAFCYDPRQRIPYNAMMLPYEEYLKVFPGTHIGRLQPAVAWRTLSTSVMLRRFSGGLNRSQNGSRSVPASPENSNHRMTNNPLPHHLIHEKNSCGAVKLDLNRVLQLPPRAVGY